ncbi:MAG: glycosyltransferase family 39 protein [Candidatus Brocadiales bacterium]
MNNLQKKPFLGAILQKHWLLVIFTGGFLVRYWLRWSLLGNPSDAYAYALGAREMISSGRYIIEMGGREFTAPYPIGTSLLLVLPFKIFGISDTVANTTIAVTGTLFILVVYLLGKRFLGDRGLVFACALSAFYPYLVHYSGCTMKEIPLTLFVATCTLGFLKGLESPAYLLLSAASLAAIFVIRAQYALFLLFPFSAYLLIGLLRNREVAWDFRRLMYIGLSLLIISLPIIQYAGYLEYRFFLAKHLLTEHVWVNLPYFLNFAVPNFTWFNIPYRHNINQVLPFPCIMLYLYFYGLYVWYKDGKIQDALLFLLAPLTCFIGLLLFPCHETRYAINMTSFFIIPAAVGYESVAKSRKIIVAKDTLYKITKIPLELKANAALHIVIISWAVYSVVFFYGPALCEKVFSPGYNGSWQKEACLWVKDNTEEESIIIANIDISMTEYYANRTTIPLSYKIVPDWARSWKDYYRRTTTPVAETKRQLQSGRHVYLLIERSINYSKRATRNLFYIVNTFSLEYVTHKGPFQAYRVIAEKPDVDLRQLKSKWKNISNNFQAINWYELSTITKWIIENTNEDDVIVTNLYPFLSDFFPNRKLLTFSPNFGDSSFTAEMLVGHVNRLKEKEECTYLVLLRIETLTDSDMDPNEAIKVTKQIPYKLMFIRKVSDTGREMHYYSEYDFFFYLIERFDINLERFIKLNMPNVLIYKINN